jgi:hypothetical protein
MGKYASGDGSAFAALGPIGCDRLPGMYANDIVGKGCWAVTGKTIPIGSSYASIQAGFELINFNFRVDGTAGAVPSQISLPGEFA